jgi:hypothetical protein
MPETNPIQLEYQSSWLAELRMKAGILAGVAALAGVAVTAESRPAEAASKDTGIGLVGFSDNEIFTEDRDQAEGTAAKIQMMGGNAVRIFYPLNKNTAWENYAKKTCNAFQAAYDHGLQPIVTFDGYDESGLGYVPTSNKEVKQFITTASSIIWTVGSNKAPGLPGGCVPGVKHFIFEGMNEINNPTFNRKLSDQTPAQTIAMDYKFSKALKREAARPEIGGSVEFGVSLAVANHDAVGFLNAEGQAEKAMKLKNPYDFIDVHPYPKDPTADPSVTMNNLYGPLTDAIDSYFPGSELAWGEIGINTVNPPTAESGDYQPPVSLKIGVSEATQVKYITNVLKTAAAEGTPWVTIFNVQDDGGGSMPSAGVFYKDGSPKSSLAAVRYRIGQNTGR